MQAEEADPDTTLITGRILVADVATRALLDSGATHSFISEAFTHKRGIQHEELSIGFSVTIPSGEELSTRRFVKNLELLFQGQSVVADFIVLPMTEFDLILGMDWMTKNDVVIYFQRRAVLVRPEGEEPFWFETARSLRKTRIISSLQAKQLVIDGCESFLASLSLTELPARPTISDVDVVRDFEDVFPDDVAGIPPDREVEFSIDLVPGTVLISKAPYRLAPTEMKEIKEQIQELLDKGEEHKQHLRTILELLRERKLLAKFDKCEFWLERVAFLGHIISKSGVEVDPSKVQAVKEWSVPRGASEIRSFLSLAGYYRKFIKGFSSIVVPLTALTKKNAKFFWSPKCQENFDVLKEALTSAPVLAMPSGQGHFVDEIQRFGLEFYAEGRAPRISALSVKTTLFDRIRVAQAVDEQLSKWIRRADERGSDLYSVVDGILLFSTAFHPQTDGQSERVIQILENLLRACAFDFQGSWSRLPLVEFAYNNSFQSTIGMAHYEALYGRKCRSPVLWDDIGEKSELGPEIVQQTIDVVSKIRDRMKTDQSRQKSYADLRRRDLEFSVGDHVFIRVAPLKGVMRFGKKGKLALRFVGPFEILDRVGTLAYRLALPPNLAGVHNVFHVSMLRKYISNPSHVLNLEPLLTYEERPDRIMGRQERRLRNKTIPMVKVKWLNHSDEEATWETEANIRTRYPKLFGKF
ncbi:uncharacterized protein [Henckelia pumila]|uniref:uncharacterized protein n=1 Tax=Henckelia pumila TaxID=405737 RepID=UPI003C6E4FEC